MSLSRTLKNKASIVRGPDFRHCETAMGDTNVASYIITWLFVTLCVTLKMLYILYFKTRFSLESPYEFTTAYTHQGK